jgi:aldehyde dehydrogenase (NAD+)
MSKTTNPKAQAHGSAHGQKTFKNFIGGQWVATASGRVKPNLNPADTREPIGHYQVSTAAEAENAVAIAKKAFAGWRATPPPRRGAILARAAAIMERRREEITHILTTEEGKCPSESGGEVQRAINAVEFMSGEGRRMNGETIPSELAHNFLYATREPLGVVALITPWNFPIAIPAWKLAAALVTGNTVVLKPASLTPWCAMALVECFQEAGLPDGVLNLVTGGGGEVGDTLIAHRDVKAISFTGSNEVGNHIAAVAGPRLAKVQLEMGGKNAVIILDDADLELATNAVLLGAFGSTGQRCTATSRAVVDRKVAGRFLDMLVDRTKKIQVGPGKDTATYMGPCVDKGQYETVLHYLDVARKDGAELVLGGKPLADGPHAHGYYVAPTIYTKVKPSMAIAREEIFGPVLSVLEVGDLSEALSVANDSPFGLASSIFTRNVSDVFRYIDAIEVGMVHVNSATIGGEVQVPFGGSKGTGFGGREMGNTAIEFFTEWKSVYVDYTGQSRKSNVY